MSKFMHSVPLSDKKNKKSNVVYWIPEFTKANSKTIDIVLDFLIRFDKKKQKNI